MAPTACRGACYSEATFFGMKDSIYGAIDRVILGGFGVSRYPPILILALALVNPCLAVEVPSRRTHQRPCACGGRICTIYSIGITVDL